MTISLDQAEALVKMARAKATEIGVAAAIVVLDDAGHLKAFARMDGGWLGSIDVAMKKARTSVLFQMETQQVWITMTAEDKESVEKYLSKSPLFPYWTFTINELFVVDGLHYRLPAMQMN